MEYSVSRLHLDETRGMLERFTFPVSSPKFSVPVQ